jgi:F0F1-type ATP synthase membrane subunit b/b'
MTFSRNTLGFISGSLLLFLVCTSKNILIFNEETLVALSFFGFVLFCYSTLQDSIGEIFQARSDAIQNELQNYLTFKEEFLKELLNEHQKQQALQNRIHQLSTFAWNELAQIEKAREESFSGLCYAEIQQKLKTLVTFQQRFQEKVQLAFGQGLRGAVLDEFQASKLQFQSKLIKQALKHLKTS